MKSYPAKPVRLVDLPAKQIPAKVGLLILSAIEAPGDEIPRVKWRIRNTLYRRVEQRSRYLRFALVSTCVFVVGGLVGAAVQPLLRAHRVASGTRPEPAPDAPVGHGTRRHARVQLPSAASLPGASAEVPSAVVPTARPVALAEAATDRATTTLSPGGRASTQTARPHPPSEATPSWPRVARSAPAPVMRAPVMPAPTTVPPTIASTPTSASADEQALIATALDKLRTAHEPKTALVALDEYQSRFPTGVLAPEAARLRTEALLLLGRRAAVLAELDSSAPSSAAIGDDRLVLRGELRAGVGRWRAALVDFDTVVRAHSAWSTNPDDQRSCERLERALWGRASARSHLGDDSGARADLREYLRRFPDGRFAIRACRLLGKHRRP